MRGASTAMGSRECTMHQREETIIQIHEKEEVTIMRTRQILGENNKFIERLARLYATHFDCKINENNKRKVTLWLLEKSLEQHPGAKPKAIKYRVRPHLM